MKKLIAEFTATFCLIFLGTGSIVVSQASNGAYGHNFVSVSWGFAVMLPIIAFGGLSGAHMNPAVTISFALGKFFRWKNVPAYLIAQFSGAIAASLLLRHLSPQNEMLGTTLPAGTELQSFVLEYFMTFGLVLVVLYVPSLDLKTRILAALLIGLTVGIEAWFGGPISGASMNPIRSLGPALVSGHTEHLWLYLTAPMLGASSAVMIKKFI